MEKTLHDRNRQLLIAQEGSSPVGTVRLDLADGVWEMSWTVAPHARGRGIARKMVAAAAGQVTEPVRAEVRSENLASARVAEHAGMRLQHERDGMRYYFREALP